MTLYHRTAAQTPFRPNGFRDASGTYMTDAFTRECGFLTCLLM